MSQPDEVNADILDAIALLTASHDEDDPDTLIRNLVRGLIDESEGVDKTTSKLLGVVAGQIVVAKKLLEYCADAPRHADEAALDNLAADVNNTTVVRHVKEMTAVANQLTDYCARQSGVGHEAVLGRLARDLHTSSGE